MHRYAQAVFERIMGSSIKLEGWTESDARRFARLCTVKAASCGCGCGEKTFPKDLQKSFVRFVKTGASPEFSTYVQKHGRYKIAGNYRPTDYQHQIIIASMLGDGSLSKPYKGYNPSARIHWNMGDEKHARYKAREFEFIGASYSEKENPGFGNRWYCVRTASHPVFSKYGERYGFKKKNIDPHSGIYSELNEVGWAWLFGDDGHTDHKLKIAHLHTESFGLEHNEIVRDALNEFIGFDGCSVHGYVGGAKKRKLFSIRMTKNGTKEFMGRIEKHMADGMEYKVIKYR